MIDTLLRQFSVPRAEFMKMFNISERTYQRWNKNPPEWVVNLFKMAITRNPLTPEIWKGWQFDGDLIIDPDGNSYHVNEVRAIFWNRQLIETLTGNRPSSILSMKAHLEKRIKATQATLNISLANDSQVIKEWKIQV